MDRTNTKQMILEKIVDRIQYLEMKPGEIINEKQLAEEMGVSRTPVRESLLLLEREGIVDIYPQYGTFVSKIDLDRIHEYLYLRTIAEKFAFKDLVEKKVKVFDKVEANLMFQDLAAKKQDFAGFVRNDYEMHKTLFEIAGHAHIWKVISQTLVHCTRLRILGWSLSNSMLDMIYKEHLDIISFIEAGDLKNLERAVENHHDSPYARYLKEVVKECGEYFINTEKYV